MRGRAVQLQRHVLLSAMHSALKCALSHPVTR
jgi:hypothetical protein